MRTHVLAVLAATCALACDEDGLSRATPTLTPDGGAFVEDAAPPPLEVDAGRAPAPRPDAGIFPEPPAADEPVYIHTGDTLFAYAPDTHVATEIGLFTTADGPLERDMVDIAIDTRGRMFGGTREAGSEGGPNEVYQIDPSTGRATFRFRFDDTLHGMTFLPTGELVVAGTRITVVDPEDGAVIRELVAAEGTFETSGDIVALPDGQLYWTVRGERRGREGMSDRVVRIDPDDGREELLGDARADRIYGLGYAEGALYGFSSAGLVVVLDPETGTVLRQRPLTGRWFGATTNPVLW